MSRTDPEPAATSTAPTRLRRPGWPEIAVGLVVGAAVTLAVPPLLRALGLTPELYGLSLTLLSGVLGLAGFAAAVLLRIRSVSAFGVRRVSWRWLLAGVAGGLLAYLFKVLAYEVYIAISGDTAPVQGVYYDALGGGVLFFVLSLLFLSVATPIGEELLFRGVVTTALLRYGPIVGVVGSALLFAVVHGVNTVFPAALVVGLITAELLRRSGSVWPGVVVHVLNNLGVPLLVLLG